MKKFSTVHPLAPLVLTMLVTGGCASTKPKLSAGTTPRTNPEAFYSEAPWMREKPLNIKAMADAAVATTQGLADISAAYQQQLQIEHQAQMKLLKDPAPYESRASEITACLQAGGGVQGGMQCERMGFEAYDAEYGDEAMNRKMRETREALSDETIRGWADYNRSHHDFENWKAGHEFGQLMIQMMNAQLDSTKAVMRQTSR